MSRNQDELWVGVGEEHLHKLEISILHLSVAEHCGSRVGEFYNSRTFSRAQIAGQWDSSERKVRTLMLRMYALASKHLWLKYKQTNKYIF